MKRKQIFESLPPLDLDPEPKRQKGDDTKVFVELPALNFEPLLGQTLFQYAIQFKDFCNGLLAETDGYVPNFSEENVTRDGTVFTLNTPKKSSLFSLSDINGGNITVTSVDSFLYGKYVSQFLKVAQEYNIKSTLSDMGIATYDLDALWRRVESESSILDPNCQMERKMPVKGWHFTVGKDTTSKSYFVQTLSASMNMPHLPREFNCFVSLDPTKEISIIIDIGPDMGESRENNIQFAQVDIKLDSTTLNPTKAEIGDFFYYYVDDLERFGPYGNIKAGHLKIFKDLHRSRAGLMMHILHEAINSICKAFGVPFISVHLQDIWTGFWKGQNINSKKLQTEEEIRRGYLKKKSWNTSEVMDDVAENGFYGAWGFKNTQYGSFKTVKSTQLRDLAAHM